MAHPANTLTLVADIGGTNTRVALAEGTQLISSTIRKFVNAEHAGLETVLTRYIEEEGGVDPIGACVAVAGPVRDGCATLTNLDWTIDEETLARATQAENVTIFNDLQAQGHALGHLPDGACRTIFDGPEAPADAAKLVIGLGTGFNIAPVIETPGGRVVAASEAGHVTLPARTAEELSLSQYLSDMHGFPAIEDALAGRGISQIYGWLGHEAGEPKEATSRDILAGMEDGTDPRAEAAIRMYCSIFGSVAGNLALIHLPFGGIWLIGGMARAMTPYLASHGFLEAFRDKGRFAGFMGNFGVQLIEDDCAALIGCASYMAGRG